MKFVHIADMHFDSPFTVLSSKSNLGDIRRLEQRKAFKKVIEYIKDNNIDYLFISGDLYEHEYVKESTIEYINNLFKEIPNTKVFITPGNHDPYIKNSIYETFIFNENVHVFKDKIEKVEDIYANIYGMAFTEFYMNTSPIENMVLQKTNKPNILVVHADLNGVRDKEGFAYNPISERKLKELGFDYVALGHIHKTNFNEQNNIVYPGSTISFGFDELGEHGMVVGEINNGSLKTEFIKLDDREFTELKLNVEIFNSKEDLIEHLIGLKLKENVIYKIILIGRRNFEINTRDILDTISSEKILKLKDETTLNYNLEEISKENNLKGIFVREVLKLANTGDYSKEEIEKAIEIGLESM